MPPYWGSKKENFKLTHALVSVFLGVEMRVEAKNKEGDGANTGKLTNCDQLREAIFRLVKLGDNTKDKYQNVSLCTKQILHLRCNCSIGI